MSQKGFDESSFGTSWSSEPFSSSESELGSTETESNDDEELLMAAELTRQMANYTLEEDDDNNDKNIASKSVPEHTEAAKWWGSSSTSTYYCDQRLMSTSATVNTTGIHYNQTFAEGQTQFIEVYELKNQPLIKEESCLGYGKRPMMIESAKQPKLKQKQEGQHHHHRMRQNKRRDGHGRNNLPTPNGSGMRAIFLNGRGSGFRNGARGTGVFLPHTIQNRFEPEGRAGCSTVLIPARVLEALESHFNNMDALSQSNGCGGSTNHNRRGDISKQKRTHEPQTQSTSNNQEMQLPEDWTY